MNLALQMLQEMTGRLRGAKKHPAGLAQALSEENW